MAVVAMLWGLGSVASPECKVDCEKGQLGVCVERDGDCYCKCIEAAKAGVKPLEQLMRDAKASDKAVEEAVRLFREATKGPTKGVAKPFSVRDGDVTFTVSVQEG
jgi:hypothetical protein